MFLKNRNISSKIKRLKVTDYAALNSNNNKNNCNNSMNMCLFMFGPITLIIIVMIIMGTLYI